jgi:uncharacterized repeat protein (TIGR02543 family)
MNVMSISAPKQGEHMGTVIEKAAPAYAIAAALILLAAGCDDFNRPLEPYVRENLSKVRAISVSPAQAGVSLGRSRQFTAAVTAFYDATTTVTWSVTGGGGGTSIDTEGLLTVGAGESEATRLTVRAVSTWDPRKSAQAVVTVRGPYTVTFDPGGGTWSGASPPSSVIYNYGETPVSEPGPGAGLIAPPGFTLAGWYTAAGGGSPVSFPYRPEADTTLYARWKSPGGPVGSAASWAAAINAVNAAPTPGNYVIDIGANSFAVDPSGNPGNNPIVDVNRTLTITGTGTISLGMAGPLLDLATGVDITLNGPTLRGTGSGSNSTPVVRLTGGSFTLQNGSIKNNNNTGNGGGVYIANAGTVTMSGGSIAGNIASSGGGVFIQGGTFTMSGGSITNNTGDSAGGGGVFISTSGTFIMNGGTITRNTGDSAGGGGVVVNRIFTLNTPASTGSIRDNLPPSSQAQVLKLGLGEINGTANPPPNGW